jgi:hypothetical protein
MIEDRIIIIDSPPGFGKTSYAIQTINKSSEDQKVIYITPFLTEVKRIIEGCPDKHFIQPNLRSGRGRKMNHLLSLILQGKNIVSTHALFSNISEELINALRLNNYILYLDEVFQTIEVYDLDDGNRKDQESVTKNDMQSLISKEYVKIGNDYVVSWIDTENMLSKYEPLKNLADRNSLYFINNSLLLWSFPIEVFREGIFDQIFIMTYRFDSQIQSSYYQYYNLPYKKYNVFQNEDKTYDIEISNDNYKEKEWKKQVKDKVHILDNPKLNRIGDLFYDAQNKPYKSSLSLSWFDSNPEMIKKLNDNIANYFKNYTDTKSNTRLWTSFKEHTKKLKSKNVSTKYWLSLNARAMNDYADRTTLCYPVNRYANPFIYQFFLKRDITIKQDEYAVTELIQWIWRSAIRNFEDINIYIPSQRMRVLLQKFLNDEEIIF